MTLLEVREQFVRQSGRYDLVTANSTTDFVDAGADFYIRQGQVFLDRRGTSSKGEAELQVSLATGEISVLLEGVRAVLGVAVEDPAEGRMRYLRRDDLRGMREWFGDESGSLAGVERGTPIAWTIGHLRDTLVGSPTTEGEFVRLIVMPPADRTYPVFVQALMASSALTSDTSVSFWTLQQPQVLVWAALYMLEVSYRNMQGAQTFLAHIDQVLAGIDNDVVEQEIVEDSFAPNRDRYIGPPRTSIERHIS